MELQEDPYEYTMVGGARNVGSVNQSAQRWADALALRLPNLESLAFETRPHTGRGLGPRVLIGRPELDVAFSWGGDSGLRHYVSC